MSDTSPTPHTPAPSGVVDVANSKARTMILGMLPSMALDVVLPLVTYFVLSAQGMDTVYALALSGVWPLLSILASFVRRRRVDEFGAFILTLIILGALTSLLLKDPRLFLLKDSALTGVIGIVFLASLLLRRPVLFYFGRKFGTDGSPAGLARWESFWNIPTFRRGQRTMTAVWGTVLLAEAIIRIPLTYVIPLNAMVVISQIFPFVVIAALIFWTMTYAKRNAVASRAEGMRLRGETGGAAAA